MGRLSNIRIVDPVLSNLAYGYQNAELIADKLFPFAPVEKEGVKIPLFGKEHFMLYNTERALRARSNRINPPDIGEVTVTLTEHDLEFPIDYREDAEAAFPLQAYATGFVTGGIRLRNEVLVAGLVQNTASYPTGNKVTLSGTSKFSDPASDPQGVIETAKEAVRQKIVKTPNTMVIGASTWSILKRHAQMKGMLANDRNRVLRVQDLADFFEIPNIYIGQAVTAADNGTVSDIWADNIVLAYVPQSDGATDRTPFEPSFGYTLRKGRPQVDTYVESGGKIELVRSTEIFQPYLLGAEAGYLIYDCV